MRRLSLVAVLAVSVVVAGCGSDSSTSKPDVMPGPGPATLKVMTQNLYLGADLELLLGAGTDLPATVELLWAAMLATDFPARAKVLADTIQAADPDLVALQEVSLWRYQQPGDHLLVPNATTVQVDFLAVLGQELAARGLAYEALSTSTNADLELPGSSGTDYRLTDRDVLLGKRSLIVTGTASGTFAHLGTLSVASPLGGTIPVSIKRGWASADVRAGGRTVRVFDTHLEAFSPEVATTQVGDLLSVAAAWPGAKVIAGDINLPPDTTGFARFVAPATGLADAWATVNPGDPGLSCCWSADLKGGSLGTRIDVVFATTTLRPTEATLLEASALTTVGNLHPSDHLGVLATFDAASATSAAAAVAATR